METKELKSVDPGIIEERFKSIEETLYSTKEILSMKDVCHYLDISQSMLYKLTCNGEIPHFKPRGKTIFFEKKQVRIVKIPSQVPNDSCSNEKEDSQEEQHWWLKSAWLSSGRTTWQVCNLRQGHQG